MSATTGISARGLTLSLGGRRILDGVGLDAAAGTITAVIGPNGAGKSTLLKAIAGLAGPASGSVEIGGRPLHGYPPRDLARTLAYLPQDRTVHWPLTARAVVALGRLPHQGRHGGESAADDTAISYAMAAMDVTPLAGRPVTELSGGERARVLVARTLAQQAPILLADEPTAGLDPAHTLQLFGVLMRLAAEGRTIVTALHDMSLAARFCHHVVLLVDGRVLAAGPPADAMSEANLANAFRVSMACGSYEGVPIVLPMAPLDGSAGRPGS